MPERAHTLDAMMCFDIYILHQRFGRLYKPLLDPLGLTYPQYLVLVVLWQVGPVAVGAVGAQVGLDSSTLTPLLKRLEAAGLVSRKRDPLDERRVLVAVTEAGRALETRASHIPACIAAATGMTQAEIADLRGQIARLGASLSKAVQG